MKPYSFFIFIFLLSCQTQKANSNLAESCFGFDQRQCKVDEFASLIKGNTQEEMFEGITTYLSNKGIALRHIRIDMDHHEMVCQACEVCPEHHRFFISIDTNNATALKNLNLFNLEPVTCGDYFN
jgi:hypothetical protein